MRQLGALLRLRARGVRLDSYLMDAFWYAPDGASARRKPDGHGAPAAGLKAVWKNYRSPASGSEYVVQAQGGTAMARLSLSMPMAGHVHVAGGFLPDLWMFCGIGTTVGRVFKLISPTSMPRRRSSATSCCLGNPCPQCGRRNGLKRLRRSVPMWCCWPIPARRRPPATDLPFRKTVDHRCGAFDAYSAAIRARPTCRP